MDIVAEPVVVGPFFSGNALPDIAGKLRWDAGGYVDLTGATAKFAVRRWDPVKKRPYGPLVTGGACSFGNARQGEVTYSWATAPLPTTPGWYAGRFVVSFPGTPARNQDSQDMVFRVMEGSPTS